MPWTKGTGRLSSRARGGGPWSRVEGGTRPRVWASACMAPATHRAKWRLQQEKVWRWLVPWGSMPVSTQWAGDAVHVGVGLKQTPTAAGPVPIVQAGATATPLRPPPLKSSSPKRAQEPPGVGGPHVGGAGQAQACHGGRVGPGPRGRPPGQRPLPARLDAGRRGLRAGRLGVPVAAIAAAAAAGGCRGGRCDGGVRVCCSFLGATCAPSAGGGGAGSLLFRKGAKGGQAD